MTLRELEYLVAVADTGHFGRAAAACNVSQPTLSMQIRKLEDRLGVVLVERTNRRVAMTAAGERVAAQARRVLAEAREIATLAKALRAPLSGPLHIGLIPTLAPYMLPWAIPALRKTYPALMAVVHEEMTGQLLGRLAAHTLDIACLALPVQNARLTTVPLFDEAFLFACHRTSPLAKVRRVDPAELASENLLLLSEGHCFRDQALAVCGLTAARGRAVADFSATSLETLKQLVAGNTGSTLLPAMAAQDVPARGPIVLKPLADGGARRIGLVWRASHPHGGEFAGLAAALRRAAPAVVRAVNR
ncbi:MAG: LysR substrate-binding domain-containing protein [Rhodospirillaceae bacterium]|nr:LysR substrate-binding domain-containing protein [Rhodospirillaceae bacterium]